MINGNITNLSNTKIFTSIVYPAKLVTKKVNGVLKGFKTPVDNPLQLIVYSNNIQDSVCFDTEVPGIKIPRSALVLPFPLIAGKNRVKILDMSQYNNFFDDIEFIFPTMTTGGIRGLLTDPDESLVIDYIGKYKTCIVPNFQGFDKLNISEFNLQPDLKEILKKYYSNGYGFIVAQTTSNTKPLQYQPFAYVHEIRSDERLFIPTRHYYKQSNTNPYSKYHSTVAASPDLDEYNEINEVKDYIYGTLMVDDKWMQMNSKKQDLKSYREKPDIEWDHELYIVNFPRLTKNPLLLKPGVRIINGDLNKMVNFYTYMESSKLPKEIVLSKPTNLFKIKIDGNYKYNHDLYL